MILPLILILIATISAGVAAYGTLPQVATLHNGLHYIEMARRLQWPLLTLSVLLAMVLLVLIITGKRKVWWLVGLAPVGALFLQIFVTGSMSNLRVIDQPEFISADAAKPLVQDEDYVVGVTINEKPIALPYRQLANCPVVVMMDRDKRVAVLWSQYANRALAFNVNRQIVPRELDIVSVPGNALLVYNARLGEFINGVTGQTLEGKTPYGFTSRIATHTLRWREWLAQHPQTYVTNMPTVSTALAVPAEPRYSLKKQMPPDMSRRVVFFPTTRPVAIPEEKITAKPLCVDLDTLPVVMFRDPQTGRLKVFERKVDDQPVHLIANFSPRRAAKGVFMLDAASNGWTAAGQALDDKDRPTGERLTPVTGFEEDQYLGVLRDWFPELQVIE